MTGTPRLPPYFDPLIEGYRSGRTGRRVHLGHWDAPARAWRGGMAAEDEVALAQARLDEILVEMAALAAGMRVLDVGCGFGGLAETIDRGVAGIAFAGLNIDARQIEICRTLRPGPGNRLDWVVADACALPFGEAAFDRVFCVEAMFHFPSRRRFFAEAARVLAPGGALVASDMVLRPAAAGPATAAALIAGYGPWPDLAGAEGDHRALAAAAGLVCAAWRDASANTLPSHCFTAPPADRALAPDDLMGRAGRALAELHRAGRLAYVYMRFDKPSANRERHP